MVQTTDTENVPDKDVQVQEGRKTFKISHPEKQTLGEATS